MHRNRSEFNETQSQSDAEICMDEVKSTASFDDIPWDAEDVVVELNSSLNRAIDNDVLIQTLTQMMTQIAEMQRQQQLNRQWDRNMMMVIILLWTLMVVGAVKLYDDGIGDNVPMLILTAVLASLFGLVCARH